MVSRAREQENVFSLYGPWVLLGLIIPGLYVFSLPFGPLRFVLYVYLLGTVFVAYLFSFLLIKSREIKKYLALSLTLLVGVLLFILFLSGLLILYPSPYSLVMNYQTTHAEVSGMTNYFEYRDVSVNVTGITANPSRFADLLLTPDQKSLQNINLNLASPPLHFGYDEFPSISSSYGVETNLIITQRDRVAYTDYFPDLAKFKYNANDFERLKSDPGADLVYSNGGFDLLTITPNN